jgi:predicted MFS family arabinose efflux permease
MSALWETVETVVRIISVLAGGWLITHVYVENIFLIAAGLTFPVFVQSFLSPKSVLTHECAQESGRPKDSFRQLLSRLRHDSETLWPVVVIVFLYSFSPGWGTPLLYYLTDAVHLSSEVFGMCRAVQHGGVLAAATLYGTLHQHVRFRPLLIVVIIVNILPAFFYLLVRETSGALLVSILIGLLSGMSTVAVFDLFMRCCPQGLEGTGTALGHAAFGVASACGDVIGATIYAHGGFIVCLMVDAVATASIVPMLLWLPAAVTTRIESQPSAALL